MSAQSEEVDPTSCEFCEEKSTKDKTVTCGVCKKRSCIACVDPAWKGKPTTLLPFILESPFFELRFTCPDCPKPEKDETNEVFHDLDSETDKKLASLESEIKDLASSLRTFQTKLCPPTDFGKNGTLPTQSYASMLRKDFPEAIKEGVKIAMNERESELYHAQALVISGIPETGNERDDVAAVERIAKALSIHVGTFDVKRMGEPKDNDLTQSPSSSSARPNSRKYRLIKWNLGTSAKQKSVLDRKSMLKDDDEFSSIYIRPSFPRSERELFSKMKDQVAMLNHEWNGGDSAYEEWVVKFGIRNGKIQKFSRSTKEDRWAGGADIPPQDYPKLKSVSRKSKGPSRPFSRPGNGEAGRHHSPK